MHELAIVGAGPAGMATAYYLRDLQLDVVILEAAHDIGGRTLSVEVGGVTSNAGALFVYRGTPAEELAVELGIRTAPFTPTSYGIHMSGTTVVDTDNDRLINRLPISEESQKQLRSFVSDAVDEYRALTDSGRLAEESMELAGARVADRLRGLEPDVAEIITSAVYGGSVASPSELSAQYALRYFASYLAHESGNRLYPLDGMLAIPRAMQDRLPAGTIRLNSRVTRVTRRTTNGATEYYSVEVDGQQPIQAHQVVLAVPAPITCRIAPDLPGWKRDALAVAKTPGATTLCVTADVTGLDPINAWAFIAVAGKAFDAIINPLPGQHRVNPAGRSFAQFVCYGNSAGYRPDLVDNPTGTRQWVEDFLAVAPQLRGRVLGAHLHTWQHCFAILTPERIAAQACIQASVDGLHFAGDHTSPTAGTHGAYAEGRRVAGIVRARR